MNTDCMTQNRNCNIDFMKGFVMALLPLFHATSGVIHFVIGLYQMPLLMLISGWLVFRVDKDINSKWLLSRLKKLLIPYLFWGIIYWLPKYGDYNMVAYVDAIFSTTYWFLVVLAIFSLLIWGAIQISNRFLSTYKYAIIIILLIIDAFLKIVSVFSDFTMSGSCAWHSTFFFGGYCLHRFWVLGKIDRRVAGICAGISAIILGAWVMMRFYGGGRATAIRYKL